MHPVQWHYQVCLGCVVHVCSILAATTHAGGCDSKHCNSNGAFVGTDSVAATQHAWQCARCRCFWTKSSQQEGVQKVRICSHCKHHSHMCHAVVFAGPLPASTARPAPSTVSAAGATGQTAQQIAMVATRPPSLPSPQLLSMAACHVKLPTTQCATGHATHSLAHPSTAPATGASGQTARQNATEATRHLCSHCMLLHSMAG